MEVADGIIVTAPEFFVLLSIAIGTILGLGRFRSFGLHRYGRVHADRRLKASNEA